MRYPGGKTLFGRIDNTAPAPTEIVFKDAQGATHTFAVDETVIVYSVWANNRATAKDLSIIHDTDSDGALDAGEQIAVFSFGAAGFGQCFWENGRGTKKITAATQKFYAVASAAGAVDIVVEVEVVNAKS